MTAWLVYWTEENISMAETTPGWEHSCWGSDRANLETNWQNGDVVYFTNIDSNNYHSMFSRLVLNEFVGSKKEAQSKINHQLTNVEFEKYWIGHKPWAELEDIPFRELAMTLEFITKNGKISTLKYGYNAQALQTPRRLTEESAEAVEALWLSYTE